MSTPKQKTVLVTGANGYIGNAVAKAFVRAGWTTWGLVRNAETRPALRAEEIIAVLGSADDKHFVSKLDNQNRVFMFDVIVSVTEQILDYASHFNNTIELLRVLATIANRHGFRPLVLFTSGCKDYGMTGLHGSGGLAPHTEESALKPPPFLADRVSHAVKVLDHTDLFDAVLLRPTSVYGYSSSYYGPMFDLAARAAEKGVLEIAADQKTIMHATHVDDCAEAYVAIAEADREVVKGQCYNISGDRYETLEEVANALVKEYKIADGVKFLPVREKIQFDSLQPVLGFSQWVSSEKLRKDMGWKTRRQLFSEGLRIYRKAYEAAGAQRHPNVQKVQALVGMVEERKEA